VGDNVSSVVSIMNFELNKKSKERQKICYIPLPHSARSVPYGDIKDGYNYSTVITIIICAFNWDGNAENTSIR
jgi:hypothetical protein